MSKNVGTVWRRWWGVWEELKGMCPGLLSGHNCHYLLKGKVSYLSSQPPLITSHRALTTGLLPCLFLVLPPMDHLLPEAGTRAAMGLYMVHLATLGSCIHPAMNGFLRVEHCTAWVAVLCGLSCKLYFYLPIPWRLTTYWWLSKCFLKKRVIKM